jgi:hypothetical protein
VAPGVAAGLAYYVSAQGVGVLAPRGWRCFSVHGSGGHTLFVRPERIVYESNRLLAPKGPQVRVSYVHGGTSGRFGVAEVIARVFPSWMSFTRRVMGEPGMEKHPVPRGPYPADVLTYRSGRVVEYVTPQNAEGLGNQPGDMKSPGAVEGVAMLIGKTPDLLVLAVSLSPQQHRVAQAITHQMERDGARMRSD